MTQYKNYSTTKYNINTLKGNSKVNKYVRDARMVKFKLKLFL